MCASETTPLLPADAFRLLCVEKDSVLCLLMAATLRQQGFRVETAENGADGWEKFQSGGFHAVITDLSLEQSEGLGFIAKLRDANKRVPIVVHASEPTWYERQQLQALAVDATVHKGIESGTLSAVVAKILGASLRAGASPPPL